MRIGLRKIEMHKQIAGGAEEAGNNLLCALQEKDLILLRPSFEVVRAGRGTVFYNPGDNVRFTYFPCGASLASFSILLPDGKSAETALIGREGAVGGIISHGDVPAYARASVEFAGEFLRIETAALEAAKARSVTIQRLFVRYADCLLAQVFQSAACNAAHSIEQRVAKLLLAGMDRMQSQILPMTQEQLSGMLGVGRSYISRVIQTMKTDKILRTTRGALIVADVQALHRRACACNDAVRNHFDTVLKGVYPCAESTVH
jgi:CRP-like cAMP-binding protein